MARMLALLAIGVLAFAPADAVAAGKQAAAGPGNGLSEPVQLEAGGEKIDVKGGFSTPYVTDWDADGKLDLLLGGGRSVQLRIYRNKGKGSVPVLDGFTLFKAAGQVGTVPDGFG